jgi:hypothetical protein
VRVKGWARPLAAPLMFATGDRRRVLVTLGDAANFILEIVPPARRSTLPWLHAADLLQRANVSGTAADVAAATVQMRRALSIEGWV